MSGGCEGMHCDGCGGGGGGGAVAAGGGGVAALVIGGLVLFGTPEGQSVVSAVVYAVELAAIIVVSLAAAVVAGWLGWRYRRPLGRAVRRVTPARRRGMPRYSPRAVRPAPRILEPRTVAAEIIHIEPAKVKR